MNLSQSLYFYKLVRIWIVQFAASCEYTVLCYSSSEQIYSSFVFYDCTTSSIVLWFDFKLHNPIVLLNPIRCLVSYKCSQVCIIPTRIQQINVLVEGHRGCQVRQKKLFTLPSKAKCGYFALTSIVYNFLTLSKV